MAANEDVLVAGELIGVDLSEGGPHVNAMFAERGRLLDAGAAGLPVAMKNSGASA